ncbi:Cell cycle checkpoint protein rad17 [Podila humilis]|nr:Cell cycle checkpoint protein rad17 [Podila humilis]
MYKAADNNFIDSTSDESLDEISDPEVEDSDEMIDSEEEEAPIVTKATATRKRTAPSGLSAVRQSKRTLFSSKTEAAKGKGAGKGTVKGTGKGTGKDMGRSTTISSSSSSSSTNTTTTSASTPSSRSGSQRSSGPIGIKTLPPTPAKRRAGETKFKPPTSLPSSMPTTPRGSNKSPPQLGSNDETVPDQWTDKYAPHTIKEVAVHPQKVDQVREWLEIYTDRRRNQEAPGSGGAILALTGPAGSGKTAVVRMLAKDLGIEIVEWVNTVNPNNVIHRPTMPDQDSWRSRSIDEAGTGTASKATAVPELGKKPSVRKNLILIEDLPPVSAFSSRKIFQETLLGFANTRDTVSSVLCIIISDVFSKQSTEMLFSSNENREEALTLRTLLPKPLLDRMGSSAKTNSRVKNIKFNPIADRFMNKAVQDVVKKEFVGKKAYAPEMKEVDQVMLVHKGDIRAVFNALQFMCSLPIKTRIRYREAEEKMAEDPFQERDLIQQYGQDTSLDLFHAVGKVLYNKRDWLDFEKYDPHIVKIPEQALDDCKIRPRIHFNPDESLIEKLPVEPELFSLMLHQNYSRHMSSIHECSTALDYLCLSEQFTSRASNLEFAQVSQMQPYMISLAVRGVLFAPMQSGPSLGGQRKAWWPEIFDVNKTQRANDQLFSETAQDFIQDEAKGLSLGHITGPGYCSKSAIRQEIVPMLGKFANANPYAPVFTRFRASTKSFIRNVVNKFGNRSYGGLAKEFGAGEEGFIEELEDGVDSAASTVSTPKSQSQSQPQPQSQLQQRPGNLSALRYGMSSSAKYQIQDEDPIEQFSD